MVLGDLGKSLAGSLARMHGATVADDAVLAGCLNEIARALLQADVRFETVRDVRANLQRAVGGLAAGANTRRVLQQAVVGELCRMLGPGAGAAPASVVLFVGLQGPGKTTTCAKYADLHRRRGFRQALVCADTFRAGALDQLKQNAARAKVPFYGSYTATDQARVAVEGVEMFRREKCCDLIIVDTSGRHRQEAALFEEMRQVAEATRPDLVVFVMDASIGQAAFDQAQAFKRAAPVGAVIVTKMDGGAKGGGALSAVATTESPVIFICTGEHMPDLEAFHVEPFVRRLLGLGNLPDLIDKIHEAMPPDDTEDDMVKKLAGGGAFTLRVMYEMFQKLQSMGPLGQIMSMIPGLGAQLMMEKGKEREGQAKMKRYMTIMDSMTDEELDGTSPKLMNRSRIARVAWGSGRLVADVVAMLEEHKRIAKVWSKLPMSKRLMNTNSHGSIKSIAGVIPPNLLRMMGGPQSLQNLARHKGGANKRK
ncbi:hypothetical protein BS78_09G042400 [Paspalum vaginatum]|nr:hypothetical protein BS78_09G042400 [Paspalum vaginatum]